MTAALQARSVKASSILSQPESVRLMAGGRYWVRSQGSKGLGYIVSPAEGTCCCPDYQKRGGPCKHILACQEASAKSGRVRILETDATTGQVLRWQPVVTAEQRAEQRRFYDETIKLFWPGR